MPELPEVHTTATGLNSLLPGKKITAVWSDYPLSVHASKSHIKSPAYFAAFDKTVVGQKILRVHRRGKNILIDLSHGHTILIHMKMTGHLLYGKYKLVDGVWEAQAAKGPLTDPFNRFLRLVFTLSNGYNVAFSDLRKFAKVLVVVTKDLAALADLSLLGPEPLEKGFTEKIFRERLLKRPRAPIKMALMDQHLVAGIGNIYSDEILWKAAIHPLERGENLSASDFKKMFTATQEILTYSISLGGDSASDYRNIYGERGGFQNKHNAYHQTKKLCKKRGCVGTIIRLKIGGRSAHFCDTHQTLRAPNKSSAHIGLKTKPSK